MTAPARSNPHGLINSGQRMDLQPHAELIDSLNAKFTAALDALHTNAVAVRGNVELSAKGHDARLRALLDGAVKELRAFAAGRQEAVSTWRSTAEADLKRALRPGGSVEENDAAIDRWHQDLRLLLSAHGAINPKDIIKNREGVVIGGTPTVESLLGVLTASGPEDARTFLASVERATPVLRHLLGGDIMVEAVRTRALVLAAPQATTAMERLDRLAKFIDQNTTTAVLRAEKLAGVFLPKDSPVVPPLPAGVE